MIADEIRAVLRSTQPIDRDQAMESLGLDSLMALELRNRLEDSLGVTLPVDPRLVLPDDLRSGWCPVRANGLRTLH